MIGFYKSRCSIIIIMERFNCVVLIPLMDAIEFRGGKEKDKDKGGPALPSRRRWSVCIIIIAESVFLGSRKTLEEMRSLARSSHSKAG